MDLSLENLKIRRTQGKNFTKKMPLSQEIKRSIFLLIFTLLTIIVLLSIVFLLNRSEETQKGYALKKQELEREEYLLQNRELINKIIEAQSFHTIQDSQNVKGMLPPENVTFIEGKKK